MNTPIHHLAQALQESNLQLTTVESCTAGGLSAQLTDQPGASRWYWGGWVVYSNNAKHTLVGVPTKLIETYGAVSAEVAEALTNGALSHSPADIAVSITGIAGPSGGSNDKPAGTVYIGWQQRGKAAQHAHHQFSGDRTAVRQAAINQAIDHLNQLLSS